MEQRPDDITNKRSNDDSEAEIGRNQKRDFRDTLLEDALNDIEKRRSRANRHNARRELKSRAAEVSGSLISASLISASRNDPVVIPEEIDRKRPKDGEVSQKSHTKKRARKAKRSFQDAEDVDDDYYPSEGWAEEDKDDMEVPTTVYDSSSDVDSAAAFAVVASSACASRGIRRDSRGSYSFVCHLRDMTNGERSDSSERIRPASSPSRLSIGERVTRVFDRVPNLLSARSSKEATDLATFLSITVEAAERALSEHEWDSEAAAIAVLTERKNEGQQEDKPIPIDAPEDRVDSESGGFCAAGNGRACPVCFDRYDSDKKPCVALDDCGHTVCGECLRRLTEVAHEKRFGKRSSKYLGQISDFTKNGRHKLAVKVPCPTCRKEATGWLKIFLA